MNYLKANPKSHDQMYITFQMRQYFAQLQDHPKTKKMCKTKELWTSQSSSNANCFHFLESKICFALKQMQRLNNEFYCA